MAEQENFPPRLTRAALKRASAMEISSSQPLAKKNRVALSDLPNLTNAGSARTGAVQSKPSRTRAKKKEQDLKLGESSCKEIEVANVSSHVADTIDKEIEVEDPQMVAPYASDIYQYLRSMEVGLGF